VTPRPFQQTAIDAVGAQFRAGKTGVVLVSPTGSGKTFMGAYMVRALMALTGRRVAWGAHRQELIDQAAATLTGMGVEVGVGGLVASARVQLGTYQSWVSRGTAPDADFFFADECHHLADRVGWQEIQRAYREKGSRTVGLTATPARGDGRALALFDAIVVAAQVRELQQLGLLVPLRIKRPGGRVGKNLIAQRPADAYLEFARGRSAVVFAPHIKAAEAYVSDFAALGVEAQLVTGTTDTPQRASILDRFESGALQVVVNVQVLTEGWDAPRCSCVILGRGCGSQALYIQMTGRALRTHPGKLDAMLIDLRGVSYDLGRPDEDREFSLDGEGISLARSVHGDRVCRVCGAVLGTLVKCPDCGIETALEIPRATGAALIDWEDSYETAKQVAKPSRMVLSLAGMLRKSSHAQAMAKFRGIFKRHPHAQLVADAVNFNKTVEKTHEALYRDALDRAYPEHQGARIPPVQVPDREEFANDGE
jgi:DNA repair protein RadD